MSAAMLVAVIPRSILIRWDSIAIAQLAAEALRLQEQNEVLESRCRFAEESAQMWQDISELERHGREVGITIDGAVIDLGKGGAA